MQSCFSGINRHWFIDIPDLNFRNMSSIMLAIMAIYFVLYCIVLYCIMYYTGKSIHTNNGTWYKNINFQPHKLLKNTL